MWIYSGVLLVYGKVWERKRNRPPLCFFFFFSLGVWRETQQSSTLWRFLIPDSTLEPSQGQDLRCCIVYPDRLSAVLRRLRQSQGKELSQQEGGGGRGRNGREGAW